MRPILILIAGGSASGKTTVVKEIQNKIGIEDAIFIKHDDYYRSQDHMTPEQRKLTNYDHPSSLENDLLFEDLNKLLNGQAIDKPIYDFVTQTRKKETEHIEPKSVIILEGILVLEDEKIRDLADIKVFVNCDDDLRFIRRLQRDVTERGRSVESVINQYLYTVKPMHHLFVKPSIRYADIIIPEGGENPVAISIITSKISSIINEKCAIISNVVE